MRKRKLTANEKLDLLFKAQEKAADRPEERKIYQLTGGPGALCISNGNSWKESEVPEGID